MRIYDARFKYLTSTSTDVLRTWKKFGFKPTTATERAARQRRMLSDKPDDSAGAHVTPIEAKRKQRSLLSIAAIKSPTSE